MTERTMGPLHWLVALRGPHSRHRTLPPHRCPSLFDPLRCANTDQRAKTNSGPALSRASGLPLKATTGDRLLSLPMPIQIAVAFAQLHEDRR